jgi:hypothetical protein
MNAFNFTDHPMKGEDVEIRNEERDKKKQEVKTQAQTVLTLSLDKITKFIYRLEFNSKYMLEMYPSRSYYFRY